MNRENNVVSIKENEELIKVLKEFNEFVNLPLGGEIWCSNNEGEIPGTRRKETPEDRIEFIQSEWLKLSEALYDLGIDLDKQEEVQEDIPFSYNNHYEIYEDLVECMKLAYNSGEIAELHFNGIGIMYNEVSIDENGQGDSVITLYREGLNEINTGNEVARIILKRNKDYKATMDEIFNIELEEI